MIILHADDLLDSGIYEKLGAGVARGHVAIESSAIDRDTELRSLRDSILFGVGRTHAVL